MLLPLAKPDSPADPSSQPAGDPRSPGAVALAVGGFPADPKPSAISSPQPFPEEPLASGFEL